MAKPVTVFSGVLGLNNREHPSRLEADERGNVELAEAVNIDISNRGKPRRRKGQTRTPMTAACHSFFDAGDYGLAVSGSSLLLVVPDFSTSVLRGGLQADRPMSYCKMAGKVFYANGYQHGYIEDQVDHVWGQATYSAADTSRVLSAPPLGHKLAAAFGRVWIAQDGVLWFTEGFSPFLCDMGRNAIPFDSRIMEVIPVRDGLFVSTMTQIVFLAGTKPEDMYQEPIADYFIIPGTAVMANIEDVPGVANNAGSSRICVATTNEGVCILGAGGMYQNITNTKLVFPERYSHGAAYIYQGKYVVTLR